MVVLKIFQITVLNKMSYLCCAFCCPEGGASHNIVCITLYISGEGRQQGKYQWRGADEGRRGKAREDEESLLPAATLKWCSNEGLATDTCYVTDFTFTKNAWITQYGQKVCINVLEPSGIHCFKDLLTVFSWIVVYYLKMCSAQWLCNVKSKYTITCKKKHK